MGGFRTRIGGIFKHFVDDLPDLEVYAKGTTSGNCPCAILAGKDEYMKLFTEK